MIKWEIGIPILDADLYSGKSTLNFDIENVLFNGVEAAGDCGYRV